MESSPVIPVPVATLSLHSGFSEASHHCFPQSELVGGGRVILAIGPHLFRHGPKHGKTRNVRAGPGIRPTSGSVFFLVLHAGWYVPWAWPQETQGFLDISVFLVFSLFSSIFYIFR